MTEHSVCIDCKWNNYPLCHGTKGFDGNYINIERQNINFKCGQKNLLVMTDLSLVEMKSSEQIKIEQLEARILALEDK